MLKKILIVSLMLFCLQGFSADIQGALSEINSTSPLKRSAAKEKDILELEAEIESNMLKNAFEGKIRAENKILLAIEKDKNCLEIKDKLLQVDGFFDSIKAGDLDIASNFLMQNSSYSANRLFVSKQVLSFKNEKVFFALSDYSISDRAPVGVDAKNGDTFLYLIYAPVCDSRLASSLYLSVLLNDTKGKFILSISSMRPAMQAPKKTKVQAKQESPKAKERLGLLDDSSKSSKVKKSEIEKARDRMQIEKEEVDQKRKAEDVLKRKADSEMLLKYKSQIEDLEKRESALHNINRSTPELLAKSRSEIAALFPYKSLLKSCVDYYEKLESIVKTQMDFEVNSSAPSALRIDSLDRDKLKLEAQIKSLNISIERSRIEYEEARKKFDDEFEILKLKKEEEERKKQEEEKKEEEARALIRESIRQATPLTGLDPSAQALRADKMVKLFSTQKYSSEKTKATAATAYEKSIFDFMENDVDSLEITKSFRHSQELMFALESLDKAKAQEILYMDKDKITASASVDLAMKKKIGFARMDTLLTKKNINETIFFLDYYNCVDGSNFGLDDASLKFTFFSYKSLPLKSKNASSSVNLVIASMENKEPAIVYFSTGILDGIVPFPSLKELNIPLVRSSLEERNVAFLKAKSTAIKKIALDSVLRKEDAVLSTIKNEKLASAILRSKDFLYLLPYLSGRSISNCASAFDSRCFNAMSLSFNVLKTKLASSSFYFALKDAQLKKDDYMPFLMEQGSECALLRYDACFFPEANTGSSTSSFYVHSFYIAIKTKGEKVGSIVFFTSENPEKIFKKASLETADISLLKDNHKEEESLSVLSTMDKSTYSYSLLERSMEKEKHAFFILEREGEFLSKTFAFGAKQALDFISIAVPPFGIHINSMLSMDDIMLNTKVKEQLNGIFGRGVNANLKQTNRAYLYSYSMKNLSEIYSSPKKDFKCVYLTFAVFSTKLAEEFSLRFYIDIAIQVEGDGAGSVVYLEKNNTLL